MLVEGPIEFALRTVEPAGQRRDAIGCGAVPFHQLHGMLDPPVAAGREVAVRAMGHVVGRAVPVHQERRQPLDRPCSTAAGLDQGKG